MGFLLALLKFGEQGFEGAFGIVVHVVSRVGFFIQISWELPVGQEFGACFGGSEDLAFVLRRAADVKMGETFYPRYGFSERIKAGAFASRCDIILAPHAGGAKAAP